MTITFDDVGKGRPLVLLHGFPLSRKMWLPQRDPLSKHCRVIVPDLPGFGDSPTAATPSVEAMADAVAEMLTALKITEPVILGGLSMGGYVCFAFVRKYADRLGGLILADTKADPDDDTGKANRDKMIGFASTNPPLAVLEQMLPKLVAANAPSSLIDTLKSIGAEQRPAGIIAALQAMRNRPDSMPTLKEVRVPTLILVGQEDAITPPSMSEAMLQALPTAKLVVLEGVGHLANLEAPEAFNQAVREFVLGLGAPTI